MQISEALKDPQIIKILAISTAVAGFAGFSLAYAASNCLLLVDKLLQIPDENKTKVLTESIKFASFFATTNILMNLKVMHELKDQPDSSLKH